MIPITTLAPFQAAVAGGRAILITDTATADVVHQAPCSGLRDNFFVRKGPTNHGRNGEYFELRRRSHCRRRHVVAG